MNEDFIKLLELEYNELKLGLQRASIEGKGTPQEVADRKEELFHTLFKKYFPFPFTITKGQIIDSFNNRSESIDCIILDPSHPHTIDKKNNKSSVIFADGVDFAIELKGKLNSETEIIRALKQVESVKKLTRIRNGLIFPKDRNENTYKISTIIYAEETYKNIEKLIYAILDYYKKNRIKRLFQFDVLIAGEYTIVNSCKGQISFNNKTGLFFAKTSEKTLAVLLFLMANMPMVQPQMNENIYNIYLGKIFQEVSYKDDWNKILEDIEKS